MVVNKSANDAATKDVKSMLRLEECAGGMGQNKSANYAAFLTAQVKEIKKKECAIDSEISYLHLHPRGRII